MDRPCGMRPAMHAHLPGWCLLLLRLFGGSNLRNSVRRCELRLLPASSTSSTAWQTPRRRPLSLWQSSFGATHVPRVLLHRMAARQGPTYIINKVSNAPKQDGGAGPPAAFPGMHCCFCKSSAAQVVRLPAFTFFWALQGQHMHAKQ